MNLPSYDQWKLTPPEPASDEAHIHALAAAEETFAEAISMLRMISVDLLERRDVEFIEHALDGLTSGQDHFCTLLPEDPRTQDQGAA